MHAEGEPSQHDQAHARAFTEVEWALRELSANLMRVAAGAGASARILRQAATLVEAIQDYREMVGHYPQAWHMDRALDAARGEETYEQAADDRRDMLQAKRDIVVGSLRIAASRLVVQPVQEQAGQTKLQHGIIDLSRVQRERAARYAAERKTAAQQPVRRAKKPSLSDWDS